MSKLVDYGAVFVKIIIKNALVDVKFSVIKIRRMENLRHIRSARKLTVMCKILPWDLW